MLLLRECGGARRWLAIMVGEAEAAALLMAHAGEASARPDTIELIGQTIEALGATLHAVEVTALADGIFYADLILGGGLRVSARPSDAIALGLRAGVPLGAAEVVLEAAALETVVFDPDEEAVDLDQAVEDFRSQLDQATPDDFRD